MFRASRRGVLNGRIHVRDVVRDRLVAVLARHPARHHLRVTANVKAVQRLDGHSGPFIRAGDAIEFRHDVAGRLGIAMEPGDHAQGNGRALIRFDENAAVNRCGNENHSVIPGLISLGSIMSPSPGAKAPGLRSGCQALYLTGGGTDSVTPFLARAWLSAVALARNALSSVIAFGSATRTSAYCVIKEGLGRS